MKKRKKTLVKRVETGSEAAQRYIENLRRKRRLLAQDLKKIGVAIKKPAVQAIGEFEAVRKPVTGFFQKSSQVFVRGVQPSIPDPNAKNIELSDWEARRVRRPKLWPGEDDFR